MGHYFLDIQYPQKMDPIYKHRWRNCCLHFLFTSHARTRTRGFMLLSSLSLSNWLNTIFFGYWLMAFFSESVSCSVGKNLKFNVQRLRRYIKEHRNIVQLLYSVYKLDPIYQKLKRLLGHTVRYSRVM